MGTQATRLCLTCGWHSHSLVREGRPTRIGTSPVDGQRGSKQMRCVDARASPIAPRKASPVITCWRQLCAQAGLSAWEAASRVIPVATWLCLHTELMPGVHAGVGLLHLVHLLGVLPGRLRALLLDALLLQHHQGQRREVGGCRSWACTCVWAACTVSGGEAKPPVLQSQACCRA